MCIRDRVWLGTDGFEALDLEVSITSASPAQGTVEVDDDEFVLRPGRKLGDRKLYAVTYEVGDKTRATVTTVEGGSAKERADDAKMKRGLAKAGFDFTKTYRGRVTSQNDDQTVEVRVDPKAPIASLSRVPLRHGLFGVTEIRVRPGAEVLVAFEDGDPQKPYAALPTKGEHLQLLRLALDELYAGCTEPVAMANPLGEWASAVNDVIVLILGKLAPAGPVSGGLAASPPGPLDAASVKLFSE